MTDAALVDSPQLPRLLLAGEAAARPVGLERALTRAGFRVVEGAVADAPAPLDALLLTVGAVDPDQLAELLRREADAPPRVILFAAGDPDLAAAALELGADDAAMAPVHLPELCARIHARIRDRQAPRRTNYEQRAREGLESFLLEARTALLPDEIVLALVRRLTRAFDLAACSFVTAEPRERGRVVADSGSPAQGDGLDLRDYPEILEALRTRRPVTMAAPGPAPTLVLPVARDGGAGAVLLLRPQQGRPPLGAAQLGLAASLGQAAARALALPARGDGTVTLDRRLHEEFERARRYSLSFALVLVAIDALEEALGRLDEEAGCRLVTDVVADMRRTLRLPDFVSRYNGDGFAIVLPETDTAGARSSVGRLRDHLARLPLEPDGRRVGLSVGIVTYPHPAVSQPDDMFALVEAALRRGRTQAGERVGVVE
ncbi:MAG TPA: diguanylate cyclase [Gemmatimonadales bacterium]|nr:diguanylate cyclase [Gemmatimonadales bacterium]